MTQMNLLSNVWILENVMKRQEDNYTRKNTSDDTNEDKIYKEIGNIEDLVQRKGINDTRSTTTLDWTRPVIDNGNKGMEGGG